MNKERKQTEELSSMNWKSVPVVTQLNLALEVKLIESSSTFLDELFVVMSLNKLNYLSNKSD